MLREALPIVIYMLLIVLLVVLIVFFIKAIYTVTRVNKIVDDVDGKIQSLNGAFALIDTITDKISSLSDLIVNTINEKLIKFFSKKRRKEIEEEEEEEYE